MGGAKYKFSWSESQHKAFEDLKFRFYSTPILTLPYLQQLFEIEIDASNYAISVVLIGHPMTYDSETLSGTIHMYPTYDKEMYSIMHAS
jgi:hypothetical protein